MALVNKKKIYVCAFFIYTEYIGESNLTKYFNKREVFFEWTYSLMNDPTSITTTFFKDYFSSYMVQNICH